MHRPLFALALMLAACGDEPNQKAVANPVVSVPADPRADCPESRARLYGECLDQRQVLAEAVALARQNGKTAIVSFGAEWCVWCHLLDRTLKGETFQVFDFTYKGETYTSKEPEAEVDQAAAKALGDYIAANFVLAHIDADDRFERQPDGGRGWDIVETVKADSAFANAVPFVFALDGDGAFLMAFDVIKAEKKDEARDYRGYDRRKLLALAQEIRAKAQ